MNHERPPAIPLSMLAVGAIAVGVALLVIALVVALS